MQVAVSYFECECVDAKLNVKREPISSRRERDFAMRKQLLTSVTTIRVWLDKETFEGFALKAIAICIQIEEFSINLFRVITI